MFFCTLSNCVLWHQNTFLYCLFLKTLQSKISIDIFTLFLFSLIYVKIYTAHIYVCVPYMWEMLAYFFTMSLNLFSLRMMYAVKSCLNVLLLFNFLISLSDCLDPTDSNVCSLWERWDCFTGPNIHTCTYIHSCICLSYLPKQCNLQYTHCLHMDQTKCIHCIHLTSVFHHFNFVTTTMQKKKILYFIFTKQKRFMECMTLH